MATVVQIIKWSFQRPPVSAVEQNIMLRAGAAGSRSRRMIAFALLHLLVVAIGWMPVLSAFRWASEAAIAAVLLPSWVPIAILLAGSVLAGIVYGAAFIITLVLWALVMRLTQFVPDATIEAYVRGYWQLAISAERKTR